MGPNTQVHVTTCRMSAALPSYWELTTVYVTRSDEELEPGSWGQETAQMTGSILGIQIWKPTSHQLCDLGEIS